MSRNRYLSVPETQFRDRYFINKEFLCESPDQRLQYKKMGKSLFSVKVVFPISNTQSNNMDNCFLIYLGIKHNALKYMYTNTHSA